MRVYVRWWVHACVRACVFVSEYARAQACYDAWEKRIYRTYKYLQTQYTSFGYNI